MKEGSKSMRFGHRKLSISNRITLAYATILLCILIIFSALTSYLVRSYFIEGSKEELLSAAIYIENDIKNNSGFKSAQFDNQHIGYNMIYNIYDNNGVLLYTNNPGFTKLAIPPKAKAMVVNEQVIKHNILVIYLNKSSIINEKPYYIQVAKNMGSVGVFAVMFLKVLVFTGLLGILVCLFSGLYLSRNVLKPIRNITAAAKELTAKSLDKRIPVDGPDDELKELANTFNSMLERLETDFEKQRRFVYDASHELRTPLAVVYGNVNMLNRWGKNDPEILSQALDTLKSESENMNKLIENLLYLAKNDNNTIILRKEHFPLKMLLAEIVDETLLIRNEYSVSYICEEGSTLYADYNAVKQVLRILIDNSIKFSTPPGEIVIMAESSPKGMLITVRDKGCGIPAEHLPYIFDRFYRVDQSRTKSTGGTGLGLSIAKQIVQSHNGTIAAESKPGEGTKMEVFIPYK